MSRSWSKYTALVVHESKASRPQRSEYLSCPLAESFWWSWQAACLNKCFLSQRVRRGLETSPPLSHFKQRLCQMVTPMIPRVIPWSLRFSGHTRAILKPHDWPHNGSCPGVRGQDSGTYAGKRVDGFQLLPLLGGMVWRGSMQGITVIPKLKITKEEPWFGAPPRCSSFASSVCPSHSSCELCS